MDEIEPAQPEDTDHEDAFGAVPESPLFADSAVDETDEGAFLPIEVAPILDVPDVVELEKRIASSGTPLSALMDRAGGRVAERVQVMFPEPCRVCVLCGSGNNGGDGWVAGRELAHRGYRVAIVTSRVPDEISAQPAHDAAVETMVSGSGRFGSLRVLVAPEPVEFEQTLAACQVVIDAVLGTGFSGTEVHEAYAAWIRALDNLHVARGSAASFCTADAGPSDPYTIAVDVPSGLSAHDGACASTCVIADETITMMVGKPGLVTPAGRRVCGRTSVACIADLAPYEAFVSARAQTAPRSL